MDLHCGPGSEARFRAYAAELSSVLGHADRVRPFGDYCVGLLSAEGRKSVEPLAAVTAPARTAAQHQSLLHLVAQAPWSDRAVLTRVRQRVLPSVTRAEPVQAWIIDDRFARMRVRPAHDDRHRREPAPEEWLLIEWPEGEAEPDHYWLATLPADIPLQRMVDLTKLPLAFARAWLADRARLSRPQAGGRARSL